MNAKKEISETGKGTDMEEQMISHVRKNNAKIINLPQNNETVVKALYENEDGDAYLLIQCLKNRYVYDHTSGEWFYWNDNHWRMDKINHIESLIKEVVQLYGEQMIYEQLSMDQAVKDKEAEKTETHKKRGKMLKKRIDELRTLRRKNNILKIASSGLGTLGITGEEWDQEPMKLACPNGVFNLKTGEFQPGKPGDMMRLHTNINFDGVESARTEWEKFLNQVYSGDKELIAYLQRLFGYAITGLNIEHVIPVFWGPRGRNGKSTIFEIFKFILGDYAFKAPVQYIMQSSVKGNGAGPDAVAIGMKGKRLVWFAESNDKDRLDVGLVKGITGGDTMSARGQRAKHQEEFSLCALSCFMTNKKPKVPANDPALWHRIHLIPHENSFIDSPDPADKFQFQADKKLRAKLEAEASGILMWLVEGCLLWQEFGLTPPEKIVTATKAYRDSQDIIGHFIQEVCITENSDYKVKTKTLYDEYKIWCQDVGHYQLAKDKFYGEIEARFGKPVKVKGVRHFKGITTENGLFS